MPKKKRRISFKDEPVAKEIEKALEEPVVIVCPCCEQEAYKVLKSRLDEAQSTDEHLELSDLTPVNPSYRARTGSVQLDCPLCAYELFLKNPLGGYSVHLEKGIYPSDYGTRSGVRIRQHHYMDPGGTMEAFRKSFFL